MRSVNVLHINEFAVEGARSRQQELQQRRIVPQQFVASPAGIRANFNVAAATSTRRIRIDDVVAARPHSQHGARRQSVTKALSRRFPSADPVGCCMVLAIGTCTLHTAGSRLRRRTRKRIGRRMCIPCSPLACQDRCATRFRASTLQLSAMGATVVTSPPSESTEEQDSDDDEDSDDDDDEGEPPWVSKLRRSFHTDDQESISRIVMAMGSTQNADKMNRAIIQEALTCPEKQGLIKFCKMLDGLRRFDTPAHHAVELWRSVETWFRRKQPTLWNWNVVIYAFVRAGDLEDALNIVRELEEDGSPAPNINTYTILIEPFAEAKGQGAALSLLARTRLRGLEPDSLIYLMMVVVCVRADPPDLNGAKMWLRKAEHRMLLEKTTKERRAVVVYNTLMSGYTKQGRLKDAFSLLGCMRRRGIRPDSYTFQILMHGCMRLSPYGTQECRQLLRVMQLIGVEPATFNYNILIRGYGTSGQLTSAMRVANRMREDGVPWDTFTYFYLISAVVTAGQVELSLRLLAKMRKDNVRPQAMHYTVTFLGLARAGFYDDASRVFRRLVSIGGLASQLSYNLMICIKVQQGDMVSALEVKDSMEAAGFPSNILTYAALLDGYLRDLEYDEALALEEPIVALRARLVETLNDPYAPAVERAAARSALEEPIEVRNWAKSYQLLIDAATWKGEWTRAVGLVESMVELELPLDLRKHGRLLQDARPSVRFKAGFRSKKGLYLDDFDEEHKLRKEVQSDWIRRVPNMQISPTPGATNRDGVAVQAVGVSPDPSVRTRSASSLFEDNSMFSQQEMPEEPVVPLHVFCASFSPAWLANAPPGARGSTEELFQHCLQGEAQIDDVYRAIHDYHHATVHRREFASLKLGEGQTLIGRTGPESLNSLQVLFETFGQPSNDSSSVVYVFMCPAAASLDALTTLLAAGGAFPNSVYLLRSEESKSVMEQLADECKERGARPLSLALDSVLHSLPSAALVNSSAMVTCAKKLVEGSPVEFETRLRAVLIPRGRPEAIAASAAVEAMATTALGVATVSVDGEVPMDDPRQSEAEANAAMSTAMTSAASPSEWASWLRSQGLRQLIRCDKDTIRLDSTVHRPALSRAEFFRVRSLDADQVVVDLWIEEEGVVAEFGGKSRRR